MTKLFPAFGFLYLHQTAIDLYFEPLREAIQSLPEGVLKLEDDCRPIITDYSDSKLAENGGIVIGYGFHLSDFEKKKVHPREGLVFCLNPPYAKEIENVKMHHTEYPSFMIGPHRFLLTRKEINLDEVKCGVLSTGEIYVKHNPRPLGPRKVNSDDPEGLPF